MVVEKFCLIRHESDSKHFPFKHWEIMGTIHSTKNSSLNFWNFPVAKGTVFSTWLNRSCQNGGFAIRFVCYSSTISSNQTFLILRSNDEMILPVNLFLTRGKFTRSYIYDYFGLNFLRHLPVRPLYDLFSVTIYCVTLHLTRSRNFSSKNWTKQVVESLTLKCVMEIILCCVKRRNIRMAGE